MGNWTLLIVNTMLLRLILIAIALSLSIVNNSLNSIVQLLLQASEATIVYAHQILYVYKL